MLKKSMLAAALILTAAQAHSQTENGHIEEVSQISAQEIKRVTYDEARNRTQILVRFHLIGCVDRLGPVVFEDQAQSDGNLRLAISGANLHDFESRYTMCVNTPVADRMVFVSGRWEQAHIQLAPLKVAARYPQGQCEAFFQGAVYDPMQKKCVSMTGSGCSPFPFDSIAACNHAWGVEG